MKVPSLFDRFVAVHRSHHSEIICGWGCVGVVAWSYLLNLPRDNFWPAACSALKKPYQIPRRLPEVHSQDNVHNTKYFLAVSGVCPQRLLGRCGPKGSQVLSVVLGLKLRVWLSSMQAWQQQVNYYRVSVGCMPQRKEGYLMGLWPTMYPLEYAYDGGNGPPEGMVRHV